MPLEWRCSGIFIVEFEQVLNHLEKTIQSQYLLKVNNGNTKTKIWISVQSKE